MKILRRAVKISFDRFNPNPYQRRYHFAIAFDVNKPIAIAQNNPVKIDYKAYQIGQKFNIKHYQRYPYVHAESHLVSKLLDNYNTIDPNWTICVLRINRKGLILGSKPCCNCDKILNAVGLTQVYYSTDCGNFSDSIGNLTSVAELTMPMSMV